MHARSFKIVALLTSLHSYRSQQKLREGNIFTAICHFVPWGRVYGWQISQRLVGTWDTYPLPGYYHRPILTPSGSHQNTYCQQSGRYAPYWNAVLLRIIFFARARSSDDLDACSMQARAPLPCPAWLRADRSYCCIPAHRASEAISSISERCSIRALINP